MARVADLSGNYPGNVSGPDPYTASDTDFVNARTVLSVTPSDTVDLPTGCRELFVGGTGNLTIIDKFGNSVLFTALAANSRVPVAAKRVMSTGTTATLIQALY